LSIKELAENNYNGQLCELIGLYKQIGDATQSLLLRASRRIQRKS